MLNVLKYVYFYEILGFYCSGNLDSDPLSYDAMWFRQGFVSPYEEPAAIFGKEVYNLDIVAYLLKAEAHC
jgi:hypothetical protein